MEFTVADIMQKNAIAAAAAGEIPAIQFSVRKYRALAQAARARTLHRDQLSIFGNTCPLCMRRFALDYPALHLSEEIGCPLWRSAYPESDGFCDGGACVLLWNDLRTETSDFRFGDVWEVSDRGIALLSDMADRLNGLLGPQDRIL